MKDLKEEPTFIITFILIIIGLFYSKNLYVYVWDDLNHWALLTKELYYLKELLFKESQVILNYYPPGISIYQYFFIGLQGFYREDLLFYANYFFLISSLICITGPLLDKQFKNLSYISIFLFLFLLISIYSACGAQFQSLYVDYFLGVFLVSILSFYINTTDKHKYLIILPLSLFPLLKGTGYFFSIFIIGFIFFNELLIKKNKKSYKVLLFCLTIFIFATIFKNSWSIFFEYKFINDIPNPSFQVKSLINMFLNSEGRDLIIKENYHHAIFNREIISLTKFIIFNSLFGTKISGLSVFSYAILVLSATSILVFYSHNYKNRKMIILTIILFILLNIIYHLSLLGMYRFIFSSNEGNNLGSFDRYLATINIATLMFISHLYLINFKGTIISTKILSKSNTLIFIIILIINLFLTGRYLLVYKGGGVDPLHAKEVKIDLEHLQNLKNKQILKFYILELGESGYGFRKARYFIYPNHSNPGSHSIGNIYSEEDIWTQNLSLNEWSSVLQEQNYDFVYFLKKDNKFWNIYKSMFQGEIDDSDLWDVSTGEDDKVILKPLKNIKLF